MTDAEGATEDVTFATVDDGCLYKQPDSSDTTFDLGNDQIGKRCAEDPATLGANIRYELALSERQLAVGDVITVAKRALYDERRNPSRLTRYTVREHADNSSSRTEFKVAQATVGTTRHTKQSTLLISNTPEVNERLRITAKSTGVAGGASGNSWVVYPYVEPDRREPAASLIEVGVDTVHRIISYTIVDGKITLANLASALNRNSTFRRSFSARVVTSAVVALDIDNASGRSLTGGESKVGVRVRFTDHVDSVADADAFTAPTSFTSLFLDGRDASDPGVTVRCLRRGEAVYLEYVANDDALLPRAGNPVRVPAALVTGYGDPAVENVAQRPFNLRSDAAIPYQFGFKDTELSGVEESGAHCDGDA